MKFPLQCFSKIITGTTGLLTASDSGQDGVGGRDRSQEGRPSLDVYIGRANEFLLKTL
ncbi:hypothetical protein HanXRQr2_Chr08g0340691 [Helianthus annuus]|uniref:Uncharacterized protein n=1 Tax=Helianthus annuus TaxID=4232 RepID=A0A9K3IFV8_HELAN|nr:hypothetical protein HanXRQr2_Chr08g0340691 [Helianthus annuus]